LLREIDSSVTRVAVLLNGNNSAHRISMRDLAAAAPKFGITLVAVSTDGTDDVDRTLAKLADARPDALLAFGYPSSREHRRRIVEFVAQKRIPAIYPNPRWMASGGLISYSVDQADNARQKAIYVDRIIKGAKPADLPVQRPVKFN
jgi:putative tryptophan/tyrosine transport system substrate-binding protein